MDLDTTYSRSVLWTWDQEAIIAESLTATEDCKFVVTCKMNE